MNPNIPNIQYEPRQPLPGKLPDVDPMGTHPGVALERQQRDPYKDRLHVTTAEALAGRVKRTKIDQNHQQDPSVPQPLEQIKARAAQLDPAAQDWTETLPGTEWMQGDKRHVLAGVETATDTTSVQATRSVKIPGAPKTETVWRTPSGTLHAAKGKRKPGVTTIEEPKSNNHRLFKRHGRVTTLFSREKVLETQHTRKHVFTVDVYNALGEIDHVLVLGEDELNMHLQGKSKHFGPLKPAEEVFFGGEAPKKISKERSIPVDTSDVDDLERSILDIADSARYDQELPNRLGGLAWESAEDHKTEILRDTITHDSTGDGGTRPVRTFIVKTTNLKNGATHIETQTWAQLNAKIAAYEGKLSAEDRKDPAKVAAHRGALNMRFEVPARTSMENIVRLGQFGIEARASGAEPNNELRVYDAKELLRYPDIGRKIPKDTLDKLRAEIEQDDKFDQYAESLSKLYKELDGVGLVRLAERMQAAYLEDAKDLSVVKPEDYNISWVLQMLAKQRYLADNPDEVSAEDKGMEVGEVGGYTRRFRFKQEELIDVHTAEQFMSAYVAKKAGVEPKTDTDNMPKIDPIGRPLQQLKIELEPDERILEKVQPHVRKHVQKAAEKGLKGKTLGYEELASLGRTLRGATGH